SAAKKVAENSFLLEEFVVREQKEERLSLNSSGNGKKALLHGHCHQRALVGTAPTIAVLKAAGYEVTEVDSGCCGMAGSFGIEKTHSDISLKSRNRPLTPAGQAAGGEVEIGAPGISCRQQIDHLARRKAKHPAELLVEVLSNES